MSSIRWTVLQAALQIVLICRGLTTICIGISNLFCFLRTSAPQDSNIGELKRGL